MQITSTPGFLAGNLFLISSIILTSTSQVMLKALLNRIGVLPSWADLPGAATASDLGQLGLIGIMIASAFLCWTISLTKLDLSYAYPIACSSALVVALLSAIVLGEVVTLRMWLGTVFIFVGIALVMPKS